MRIAVFSDIHSNLSALTASLAYAKHLGAEGFAFLGDLISDGPDPHALLGALRDLASQRPCWFVRGNREEVILSHHDQPNANWVAGTPGGSLLYTYQRLTGDDIAFLSAMPQVARIEAPGCPPVLMCHATPQNINAAIFPGTEVADALLRGVEESTVLTGHCHLQYRYEAGGKQLVNPGSVGIHKGGQCRAQFAIIRCEDGRWITRLLNVEYDRLQELKRYEGSQLPEMGGTYTKLIINSIRTGQSRIEDCIALAQSLAQVEKGGFIPEPYWEAAAKQLGVG